jgi:hypothetical protein
MIKTLMCSHQFETALTKSKLSPLHIHPSKSITSQSNADRSLGQICRDYLGAHEGMDGGGGWMMMIYVMRDNENEKFPFELLQSNTIQHITMCLIATVRDSRHTLALPYAKTSSLHSRYAERQQFNKFDIHSFSLCRAIFM